MQLEINSLILNLQRFWDEFDLYVAAFASRLTD